MEADVQELQLIAAYMGDLNDNFSPPESILTVQSEIFDVNGESLGRVRWNAEWKEYCLDPE